MDHEKAKELVSRLNSQGKMRFKDGASWEQIKAFEKNNAITLPQKLKEWLVITDGGELFLPGGLQLYGVAHNPMIDVNETDKPSDNYIVIGTLASGDPVLCEKDSERISIYNHDAGRIETDESYSDFDSFMLDLSRLLGIEG